MEIQTGAYEENVEKFTSEELRQMLNDGRISEILFDVLIAGIEEEEN